MKAILKKLLEAFQPVYETATPQTTKLVTEPKPVAEIYDVFPSLLERDSVFSDPSYASVPGNIYHSSFDDPFKQLS